MSKARDNLDAISQSLYKIAGRKNLLINGNFIINQRSFDGNWSGLSNGVYGYNRWKKHASGIEQIIEGGWFLTGTYTITWKGAGTALVNGVSKAKGDTFQVTDASANISVVVPQDATYIQVEKGTVETEFEITHIGTELLLCQRYYETGNLSTAVPTGGDTNNLLSGSSYKVRKRVKPTVVWSSEFSTNITSFVYGGWQQSNDWIDIYGGVRLPNTQSQFYFNFSADAEL